MATNVMARELRAARGIGTSFRQQVWLLGVSGRWIYLVLGLLAVLLLIARSDTPREIPRILFVALIALPVGAIWAIAVWRGEGPNRRHYHWSLPVPRPAHDLARVAVGAMYLLGALAVLAAAGVLTAFMDGTFARFASFSAEAWANIFVAPLIVYLLVTPFMLWSDYAITRWVIWIFFGLPFLAVLTVRAWQRFEFVGWALDQTLGEGDWALGTALWTGTLRAIEESIEATGGSVSWSGDLWWTAASLWLVLGLALTLFAGIYRPDDLTRLVRGARRTAVRG